MFCGFRDLSRNSCLQRPRNSEQNGDPVSPNVLARCQVRRARTPPLRVSGKEPSVQFGSCQSVGWHVGGSRCVALFRWAGYGSPLRVMDPARSTSCPPLRILSAVRKKAHHEILPGGGRFPLLGEHHTATPRLRPSPERVPRGANYPSRIAARRSSIFTGTVGETAVIHLHPPK